MQPSHRHPSPAIGTACRRLPACRRPARGLTLVESMVALAIVAILLGLAVPSLQQLRSRAGVEAVAAQLETDLQLARSLAVQQARGVRVSFEAAAGASCYVLHTGAAGACGCGVARPAACSGGAEALRTVEAAQTAAARLQPNVASILFDPLRGTSTPAGTVRVLALDGRSALHQVVNIMGRVRSCSPGGLTGHVAC